jgi:hypothetical protein
LLPLLLAALGLGSLRVGAAGLGVVDRTHVGLWVVLGRDKCLRWMVCKRLSNCDNRADKVITARGY